MNLKHQKSLQSADGCVPLAMNFAITCNADTSAITPGNGHLAMELQQQPANTPIVYNTGGTYNYSLTVINEKRWFVEIQLIVLLKHFQNLYNCKPLIYYVSGTGITISATSCLIPFMVCSGSWVELYKLCFSGNSDSARGI
jgi:hypothetical protein